MTKDKLASVFRFYRHYLSETHGIEPCEYKEMANNFEHIAWMCETAELDFIPNGRIEKAMRWLGFVQGVLFCRGVFKLDELKNHSRPDEDKKELT